MITCGFLLDKLQSAIDDKSDETKVDLRNHLNTAYQMIAGIRPWQTLMKQVTQSTTVLPADVSMLYYVEDDTDYIYFRSGIPGRYTSARLYNWFRNMTQGTPLLTGTDGATTINSTTVTSATGGFTAAMVGEYIRIGENLGIYKISARTDTNTIVLTDAFRGADLSVPSSPANLTSQYFEVRPRSTKIIAFTDESGDAISSSTVKVWYSAIPLPLYNDYDEILLPGTGDALFFYVLKMMDRTNKYTNDALKLDQDYQAALDQMISLDPTEGRKNRPRDRYGNPFFFGRWRRYGNVRYDSSNRAIIG